MSDAPQTDTPIVRTEVDGDDVVVARIDDGKANAITVDMVDGLHAALDRADADDIGAVAIMGRPGKFSAGFDLTVMRSGMDEARHLLRVGAELALRIYAFPRPVVLGCTGHAMAMGSILLLAADTRIGALGQFKIGLNEVAIGMPVPRFAVELARDRLSTRQFVPAVAHAKLFDPQGAIDAGYLDLAVEPDDVETVAVEHAHHLAASLQRGAFVLTRRFMRDELGRRLQDGMDADVALFDIQA
jgi:enoyl-CoA hydratase